MINTLDIGFVYAISLPNGRTKIGKTKNPDKRIKDIISISGHQGCDGVTYKAIETAKFSSVEASCHRAAKAEGLHISGEWFSCSIEYAVDLINSLSVEFSKEEAENDRKACDANMKAMGDRFTEMLGSLMSPSSSNSSFDDDLLASTIATLDELDRPDLVDKIFNGEMSHLGNVALLVIQVSAMRAEIDNSKVIQSEMLDLINSQSDAIFLASRMINNS